MSVKVIVELNPFRSTRTKVTVTPKSINEILKNLNSGFPVSQARVCRNGEIIKDFSQQANDGDTLWIKFVPYGTTQEAGIGMKLGGWTLMIAGIMISALSWGTLGFVGVAMIGTGLSMALGGTVLLNFNIPKLEDREKPDADPSIRGGKNQARPHGRIPVLFGKHRIYPDVAANSYTEISGNNQYLIQLFCGGYRDYKIDCDSFKLGETDLVKFSQTKDINAILSGNDPVIQMEILQNGEASNLYPYCVHEDVINAPLQNQIDDGDGNMISGEIERTTPDNTDKLNVDIFFHNGLGKYNKEGDLETANVEVWVSYKKIDDKDYTILTSFNISGSELKTKRFQTSKSDLTPGQYTIKVERRSEDSTDSNTIDQVHIGSIRSFKTKDADGNPVRPIRAQRQKNLTIIVLRVMATAKLNNVLDSFNYVATSTLPVHSPNGSGPLYWVNIEETQNPAAMLMYALRGRASQQHVDDDDIDWTSIEEFSAWCDDHKYTCNAYLSESVTIAQLIKMIGSTSRADILRIDSKISVVQDVKRLAPVQLFTPKNSISYSITMFQADVPEAISLRFIDEKAGYAQNELSVYNTPDGNGGEKDPDTIQKNDLWGITDDKQARRIGMYNYACLKNRPFVHMIEVDIEYLLCNKGDWIQYAGDIALTGSVQGRIKGIIYADGVCVGIDTDEPVVPTDGQQHAVRIRLSNGTIILKDVVFYPGFLREKAITYHVVDESSDDLNDPMLGDMYVIDEVGNYYYEPQNVIYFIEPITDNNIPKAGDIYAFGVHGYEVIDLIITDIQPQADLNATLTCVEYSPEIFKVDDPDFILPDFVNKITPVSSAVDSGIVNTNNWRSFFVFHDSEEEPSRPAGDGQNDGWYRSQNFRSLWQSTKIAETIDTGEWSPPQRINARRGTDDITPIWLSLAPQNITLDTDGDGNVLAGLLPATSQARLHQWNSVLSDVVYSLQGALAGVSIDPNGLITIAANNGLTDTNQITVRAEYKGGTYTATLTILKNFNSSAPRYLGTINALNTANATVSIIKGPVQGQVTARQGDYVLAIALINSKPAGSVFQWTGVAWEYRAPETHAELYMRCFKDGLDVPALTQDIGWFGAVFARLLVAQQAFIEELQSQLIKVNNAIFGGPRFTKNAQGQIIDNGSSLNGFKLGADGKLIASNGEFSGDLNAQFINIGGRVTAGTNYIIKRNNIRTSSTTLVTDGESSSIIKEIITAARGTVVVRTLTGGWYTASAVMNIHVNDIIVATSPLSSNPVDTIVNLLEEVNSIGISFTKISGTNPSLFLYDFEIRCRENPRFLKLLG